jgi:hypothetical protein
MGRAERRKAMKSKLFFNAQGTKEITQSVQDSFSQWLLNSNKSESDFLSLAEIRPFAIIKQTRGNAIAIAIGTEKEEAFYIFGKPFFSPPNYSIKEFNMDMSLMLLFMATKLDNEYANNPAYPSRKEKGCCYFDQQAKNFIRLYLR